MTSSQWGCQQKGHVRPMGYKFDENFKYRLYTKSF